MAAWRMALVGAGRPGPLVPRCRDRPGPVLPGTVISGPAWAGGGRAGVQLAKVVLDGRFSACLWCAVLNGCRAACRGQGPGRRVVHAAWRRWLRHRALHPYMPAVLAARPSRCPECSHHGSGRGGAFRSAPSRRSDGTGARRAAANGYRFSGRLSNPSNRSAGALGRVCVAFGAVRRRPSVRAVPSRVVCR